MKGIGIHAIVFYSVIQRPPVNWVQRQFQYPSYFIRAEGGKTLLESYTSFCLLFSGDNSEEVVEICCLYNSYVVINVDDGKIMQLASNIIIGCSYLSGTRSAEVLAMCFLCDHVNKLNSTGRLGNTLLFCRLRWHGAENINLLLVESRSYWSNWMALPFVAPPVYTWR